MQDAKQLDKRWYRNIPNMLTILRVILIVPMAVLFLRGERLWSLLFFLLAGLSDLLDGFLARRLDIISNFGKVMDPVADKLMLLTIIVCLFVAGDLPLWIIAVIFGKELVMLLGNYRDGMKTPHMRIDSLVVTWYPPKQTALDSLTRRLLDYKLTVDGKEWKYATQDSLTLGVHPPRAVEERDINP